MRRPRLPLFCMFCVILAASAFAMTTHERTAAAQAASGDQRAQARDHYVAGKKLYDAGAYQQAIGEFQAADQLSPSGVNDFNIGLCYDKLGDASNAITHYQAYLQRVPAADNRAVVEASIGRLTDAAKKQDADAAAKKAADDAAAKKAADDAAAAAAASAAAAAKSAGPGTAPSGPAIAPPPVTGTVAPAPPAHTGDADLDRVAAVDINSIHDQRHPTGPAVPAPGGAAVGSTPGATGAPAGATGMVPGQSTGPTAAASVGTTPGNGSVPPPNGPPDQPKQQAYYKKWWFWVIVGVGVVVAINVLSSSPNSQAGTTRGALLDDMPRAMPAPSGGMTLLHF